MMKYIAPVFILVGVCSASYGGGGVSVGHGSYDANVDAAIHSKHSVQTIPFAGSRSIARSPVVDINSGPLPLTLRFNSVSSRINAIQKHVGHPGQVQKQNAVDEPDLLIQNVRKPVVQEVREIITPFRQITQEVRPVQEQIETIIARGQGGNSGVGVGGAGIGLGGGYGSGYGHGGGGGGKYVGSTSGGEHY